MIEVENLTKRYGRHTAVDGISFRVHKGEILGFLGPNGAGKTTTIRILTCYLPPTDGTARVAGYDVFEQPIEVKRRVGYTPETPPLYPDLDVGSFLDFCAKIKGVPATQRKARISEAMDKTRVSDVRRTLIGRLSKGYRQRVGLAQAILHNPDVVVLDEPTSGLDPKQIIETRELIRSLAGDHTIILSTHILSEVEHSCERVIIINQGKLVAQDTVINLTNRLRGSEQVALEIQASNGDLNHAEVRQRLEQVAGVGRVVLKDTKDNHCAFEVESLQGRSIRAELARAVVTAGWDLNELRPVGFSLEDIFLQLTASEKAEKSDKVEKAEKVEKPEKVEKTTEAGG